MSEKVEIAGRVADGASGLAVAGVEVRAIARTRRLSRELARTVTGDGGGFVLAYESGDPEMLAPPEPLDPTPVPVPGDTDIISLAVYRGDNLLPGKDAKETLWDGSPEVLLIVDAGLDEQPVPDPTTDPAPAPEPEPLPAALTITELGESLAVTAASVQQELARYPTANGAFVLDDLDIEIPVGFSIDRLGQLRVNVGAAADGTSEPAGRFRLRVKPLLEPPEPPSVTAPQPLDILDTLSPQMIAKLEAQRVYSVGDLLRISRNPAGRRALDELGVPDVDDVRARAEVVALPTVPSRIAESLVKVGVADPKAFVAADTGKLAEQLSDQLGERLEAKDVAAWQARTRPLVTISRAEAEAA